jgi:hypothetical protein
MECGGNGIKLTAKYSFQENTHISEVMCEKCSGKGATYSYISPQYLFEAMKPLILEFLKQNIGQVMSNLGDKEAADLINKMKNGVVNQVINA